MEAYSTQVMELLSLEKNLDGCFQIKVSITQQDRKASYVVDIDEFTYLHLEALQPINGDRVRLSPYPKWDPYRNTYYGTMARSNGAPRDTLYFACSEQYIAQLQRIRMMELPSVSSVEDDRDAGKVGENGKQLRGRQFSERMSRRALRPWIISGLMLVLFIGIEWGDLTDSVDSLNRHIAARAAGTTEQSNNAVVPALRDEQQDSDVAKTAQIELEAQTDPNPDQAVPPQASTQQDYEVMEIEDGNMFFGLPEGYVALTFDDGPSSLTKKIVDILTEQNVAATFFFIGKNADRNPDAVTYASERGMSIGNHSWDHSLLTKASSVVQGENMAKATGVLESLTNTPVTLFRPPYGSMNEELVSRAKEQHMKITMWNRDPQDWNAKKPEDILEYFHNIKSSGGVYVLHEDKNTVEALPDIIQYLKEQNLKFVTFK